MGDTRDRQAQLRIDEQADLQAALKRMRIATKEFPNGRTSYRHAGMELARVPGEEKLRARRTSQGASAEVQGEGSDENPIAGGEFGEDRQDALEAD